jgi:hypothetical protein
MIDSQTGKDYFSLEQNSRLFAIAQEITNETGVLIAHETHRNKALFAAPISKDLLVANPEVHITAAIASRQRYLIHVSLTGKLNSMSLSNLQLGVSDSFGLRFGWQTYPHATG